MSNLNARDNQVWDRLFEILYDCDESLTDAEVDAELKAAGIDPLAGFSEFQAIIEQHRAREQFARAGDLRSSMMEKLRDVIAEPVADLKAGIRSLIERRFSGTAQVAHFQKLEKAATEADLNSLYEDLTRLAAIQEGKKEDESEAK